MHETENAFSVRSPLEEGEIRIVTLDLKRYSSFEEEASALLSEDERGRAGRFKVQGAAGRFVLVRGLLRRCLGEILAVDPAALAFEYGAKGKPSLRGGASALSFNLSHSGDLAAFAFARERAVGVDIERLRPLRDDDLPERFFSVPESVVFRVTPSEKKEEAFFHFWTAKEAYLKALGDGMTRGLKNYSFSDPWEMPPRLTWVSWDANETGRWRFHRFHPSEGYVGTLAYAGDSAKVSEFNSL